MKAFESVTSCFGAMRTISLVEINLRRFLLSGICIEQLAGINVQLAAIRGSLERYYTVKQTVRQANGLSNIYLL